MSILTNISLIEKYFKKSESKNLINNFKCFTLYDNEIFNKKDNQKLTQLIDYDQVINKCNYERFDDTLYYNNNFYNRLYFDIDHFDKINTLGQLIFNIKQILNTFLYEDTFKLSITGYIRDSAENITKFINDENNNIEDFYVIQKKAPITKEEQKQNIKKYSFHIVVLNVLFKTDDLFKIFGYLLQNKQYFYKTYDVEIDDSVYKLDKKSQQNLRITLSDKSITKGKSQKTAINASKLKDYGLKFSNLLFISTVGIFEKNEQTDKFLNYDLTYLKQHQTKNEQQKQTQQEQTQQDKKTNSIFQYIKKYKDNQKTKYEIINIKDIYQNKNKFDFSTYILPFCSMVLTPNEIIKEIKNLDLPDDIEGFQPLNDWLDEVIKTLKSKIKQDLKNMTPLYTFKSYIKEYKDTNARPEQQHEKINEELNEKLNEHLNHIDYYIRKYKKINFIYHDFYDVDESEEKNKIKFVYNFYKLRNGKIINAYNNDIFESKNEFKNQFHLSGSTTNELFDKFVTFTNIEEYDKMKVEHYYNILTDIDKNIINDNINKYVKLFKDTFKNDDDFKYTLGWMAEKVEQKTTIWKGLINQGDENTNAKDSLKTFTIDLLSHELKSTEASIGNLTKTHLNGAYFTGHILCIDELPQKPTDIDTLINSIKSHSSKHYLQIEEKGKDTRTIKNNLDFIINTNYTIKNILKNSNDCETIFKRCRVIEKKPIKKDQKNIQLLKTISKNIKIYSFRFCEYLKTQCSEYKTYFNDNFDKFNKIMERLINATSNENEMNKVLINQSLKEFTDEFQKEYMDIEKKRLKITKLRDRFYELKVFGKINLKTFKQYLIMLLTEEDGLISISDDKNKDITIKNDKVYQIIYNKYFEYDDGVIQAGQTTTSKQQPANKQQTTTSKQTDIEEEQMVQDN